MAGGSVSGAIVDAVSTCGSPDRCASTGSPAPGTVLDPTLLSALAPLSNSGNYSARSAAGPERCDLFAIDVASGFGGLFFWDRSVTGCDSSTPASVPSPAAGNIVSLTSCWRPIFLALQSGTVEDVMGWTNVDSSGWNPSSSAETAVASTSPVGTSSITFPSGYQAVQPDWSACQVNWKDDGVVACTACDGTRPVVTLAGTKVRLDLTTPSAVPVMSFRRSALSVPADVLTTSTPPSNDDPSGWAPVTLLISGNATLSSGSTLALGFGVAQGAPSLVVDGELDTDGNAVLSTAGSVFVGDDVDFDGTPTFEVYGAIVVKGDFEADGDTEVRQDYQFDVFNLGNLPLIAPPTTSRALR
jgi:hypothetical protein